ncbi:reverse transcriptase domain-containing protein [Tanacetum coccineum]
MADNQPIWGNNRAVAPTLGAAIVAVDLGDNFTVKGHHLSMIKDRQFDGHTIKLKLFPSSLAGDAKVWFNELSSGVITAWEEMRQAFVSRFFPPAMFDRLMGEIQGFTQHPNESLVDASLDVGGIFLYKTPNEAHWFLEDRVLLKLDWSKYIKAKPLWKTVALAEGPHPSTECDDKLMGGPKDEEANYAYRGYRGGGYQGNYYGRSSENWHDSQPKDDNQNSQPREDNPFIPPTPEKKFDESDFEKTMREFMVAQKSLNGFVKNRFFNLKPKLSKDKIITKLRFKTLK